MKFKELFYESQKVEVSFDPDAMDSEDIKNWQKRAKEDFGITIQTQNFPGYAYAIGSKRDINNWINDDYQMAMGVEKV